MCVISSTLYTIISITKSISLFILMTFLLGRRPNAPAFFNYHNIEMKAIGLEQPSGVVFVAGEQGLWVVSDNTNRIFNLFPDGNLNENGTIHLPEKVLKGWRFTPI